jgi:hypothetical protein
MHDGWHHVACDRCGNYKITEEAVREWNEAILVRLDDRQKANASGWLMEHQGVELMSEDLAALENVQAPSLAERGHRLLKELARRTRSAGEAIQVVWTGDNQQRITWDLVGMSWSTSPRELGFLLDQYLKDYKRFLYQNPGNHEYYLVKPEGYDYLEEMQKVASESQVGFCAMWFDRDLNPLWEIAIEPAILGARYEPKRIDRHEHNNRIDDEIVAMIRRSKFVVADLTGQRGGVYFEAGHALGLGLPVVWTCRQDQLDQVHFDSRQYNFVTWEHDNLADFRTRLQNRIEATIGLGTYRPD